MSIKKSSKLYGITLIEVLIAIYIFGVGILVIMRMLISNISRLYDIRTKDTAVNLAKEAMDIVFHLRDSNIEKGMNWDCVDIGYNGGSWQCNRSLLSGGTLTRYTIDRSLTGMYLFSEIASTGNATIRFHTGTLYVQSGSSFTGFWYNHQSTNAIYTNFFRRIEIFPHPNYPSNTNRVLGVRSIVQYTKGGNTKQVVLESALGDMR